MSSTVIALILMNLIPRPVKSSLDLQAVHIATVSDHETLLLIYEKVGRSEDKYADITDSFAFRCKSRVPMSIRGD